MYRHTNKVTAVAKGDSDATRTPSTPWQLPTRAVSGSVPVNAHNERLDLYMIPPTESQWVAFKKRRTVKKLCTPFYLRSPNVCTRKNCDFDHTPIDSDTLYCLQYTLKGHPCSSRSACRRPHCYHGHVCQKSSCAKGKMNTCIMAHTMHGMDCKVARWVRPDESAIADSTASLSPDDKEVLENPADVEATTQACTSWEDLHALDVSTQSDMSQATAQVSEGVQNTTWPTIGVLIDI